MIRATDRLYSKGSWLVLELGVPLERLWGGLTKCGNKDPFRVTY